MTPLDLDVLLAYHLGELDGRTEAEVEERLFADEGSARRLEAMVRTGDALRALVRSGRLAAVLTAGALDRLREGGITIHTYDAIPGETLPCGPAPTDLVALRLHGVAGTTVDLQRETIDATGARQVERHADVPVDPSGEIVLVHPGSYIRALPRCEVRILVRGVAGEQEFHLDHDPARVLRE